MKKSKNNPAAGPAVPIGKRVIDVLHVAHRANLNVLLIGETGIGKSEIVRQACIEAKLQIIVLDLSLLEPPDLVGLPRIEYGRTTYAAPGCLPTAGQGILMLDELNRAERHMQAPALQLLTAGTLHDYCLPEGWTIVAAINPDDSVYDVNPLDPALKARFLQLKVSTDVGSWRTWAVANQLHPAVIALSRRHERLIEAVPPRTWKYVSDLLFQLGSPETSVAQDALRGYLDDFWVDTLTETFQTEHVKQDSFDLDLALAEYDTNPALQHQLGSINSQGRTDTLNAIAGDLLRILGDTAGVTRRLQNQRLRLSALELLMAQLPGDYRADAQAHIARTRPLIAQLGVTPAWAVTEYTSRRDTILKWMNEPNLRHRFLLLCHELTNAVQNDVQVRNALRRSTGARARMSAFIKDAGENLPGELEGALADLMS